MIMLCAKFLSYMYTNNLTVYVNYCNVYVLEYGGLCSRNCNVKLHLMPGRALFDKLHNFKTIAPAKHTYVI